MLWSSKYASTFYVKEWAMRVCVRSGTSYELIYSSFLKCEVSGSVFLDFAASDRCVLAR